MMWVQQEHLCNSPSKMHYLNCEEIDKTQSMKILQNNCWSPQKVSKLMKMKTRQTVPEANML